jgi:hypothetical protein
VTRAAPREVTGLVDATELEEVQGEDDAQEDGDDEDRGHGAAPKKETTVAAALAARDADRKAEPR